MKNKLISVNDKLPPIGLEVLIFEKYSDLPCIAYRKTDSIGGFIWIPDRTFLYADGTWESLIEDKDVEYWMELPEMPWKEKRDQNES